jgi:hypothetical protein
VVRRRGGYKDGVLTALVAFQEEDERTKSAQLFYHCECFSKAMIQQAGPHQHANTTLVDTPASRMVC